MIARSIEKQLISHLGTFPAVAVLGSRQVGKTTLVKKLSNEVFINSITLDLENPGDLAMLRNPLEFFKIHQDKTVIIDEVQRMPEIFPLLRVAIDQHRVPARFLITGSASPDLLWLSNETLSGRIIYHELTPFLYPEIANLKGIREHWFRGGFPEPFLMSDVSLREVWYRSFILTYIERDLPNLGLGNQSADVSRLFSMIAHQNSCLLNVSNLAKSLELGMHKIKNILDYFERSYIIRRLQPWHFSTKKRLIKAPKVYIRDTGLLHSVLGITSYEDLLGNPYLGNSWEAYIIEQIIDLLGDKYEYYFYRTADGAECDLIIANGIKLKSCIEIKFTDSPKRSKSLSQVINDLKTVDNYIIIPEVKSSYPIGENLVVTDLNGFFMKFLS